MKYLWYGQSQKLTIVSLIYCTVPQECHLCRVAGNTVWSHMAREFPYSGEACGELLYPVTLLYKWKNNRPNDKKLKSKNEIIQKDRTQKKKPWSQPWGKRGVYGGNDLRKKIGFKPRVKERRTLDDERGDGTQTVEMTEVEREREKSVEKWGWCSKYGSLYQRHGEAYRKERSVISRYDVGGRARVTSDEERVLRGGWTVMRWCR